MHTIDCSFDTSIIGAYHSHSQIIRVLTESWLEKNMYCPRCGNYTLEHFPNNKAVADFFCTTCKNEYELKSKNGRIGTKINDGAYDTFIERITSNNNPDFFIMTYDKEALYVRNLWVIPKHFFVPAIVEKRKPLSANAKRSGWIGCNILMDQIPQQGKIKIIQDSLPIAKALVTQQVQEASLLLKKSIDARGWLLDVLSCVNNLNTDIFTLTDIYSFEAAFRQKHPQNHNIRAKIRQQLQFLRDKGVIAFLDRGVYQKL